MQALGGGEQIAILEKRWGRNSLSPETFVIKFVCFETPIIVW